MDSRACPVCDHPIPPDFVACPIDGTPFDATRPKVDPLLGAMVGDYRVERRIGLGGQGIVYAAMQPVIGKRAAIKVLRPDVSGDPEQARRLLDEAKAVNAVGSRAVVDVFGFGRLPDGRHYLVMEFLSGVSLEERKAKGRLPLKEALELLEQVAAALAMVHAKAVVHRDLKPSNVFLVDDGGGRYVKLVDFGLAKRVQNADLTVAQTSNLRVVGTPMYLAPEQARAQPVSPATDLYALGVMGFELVTGSPPYMGATPLDVISAHLSSPVPLASTFEPTVPPPLDRLLEQLMSKDAAQRPVSATAVKQQLAEIRQTLGLATTEPALVPSPERAWPVWAVAAGLLGVAVAGAAMLWAREGAAPPVVAAPPPPPPVAAPAPKPVEAAAPAEPEVSARVVKAPSAEQLTARIERLSEQLEQSGRSDRTSGLALLNKQKLAATHATSPAERAAIARAVDQVEALYRQ
jgi:serine/threonine-protein kinase